MVVVNTDNIFVIIVRNFSIALYGGGHPHRRRAGGVVPLPSAVLGLAYLPREALGALDAFQGLRRFEGVIALFAPVGGEGHAGFPYSKDRLDRVHDCHIWFPYDRGSNNHPTAVTYTENPQVMTATHRRGWISTRNGPRESDKPADEQTVIGFFGRCNSSSQVSRESPLHGLGGIVESARFRTGRRTRVTCSPGRDPPSPIQDHPIPPRFDHSMTERTQITYGIRPVLSVFSTVLMELGILFLVSVWTVMWIFLSMVSAEAQGPLEGAIIGVYSLTPAILVILWRLSVRTSLELPGIADIVGTAGHRETAEEDGPVESEVVDRFETGE